MFAKWRQITTRSTKAESRHALSGTSKDLKTRYPLFAGLSWIHGMPLMLFLLPFLFTKQCSTQCGFFTFSTENWSVSLRGTHGGASGNISPSRCGAVHGLPSLCKRDSSCNDNRYEIGSESFNNQLGLGMPESHQYLH